MPIFLHASFLHIFSNTIFALIFVTMLESIVKQLKMFFIWVIGGMGGILFSSLCDDNPSVGASTSLMAGLGAFLGFLILNWKALESNKTGRCILLVIILFVAIMQILFGFSSNNVDNYGHLGGLLIGIFLGMSIVNILPTDQNRHLLQGWH